MTDTNQLPERLRKAITEIRRKPYPISDLIPLLSAAADALQARAQVQGEPVNLQHMAVAENGALRWMAGRKVQNCELYAMPDFGMAPTLYTTPQPAQATQAEVTGADAIFEDWIKAACLSYSPDADIIEPDKYTHLCKDDITQLIRVVESRAILALRPERVPMTDGELFALLQKTAEGIDSFNIVMTHWKCVARAVEAHHGIKAQAKKETP